MHTLAGVGAWRRLRCGSLEASKHEPGAPLQLITCSSCDASESWKELEGFACCLG